MSQVIVRKEIVEIGRRVYDRGYVAANDGNISVRIDSDAILITPSGVSKGFMTPEMLVVCDMKGKSLSGPWKASSEIIMHLNVYKKRPDIKAIVHAHPPYSTAFGICGIPLTQAVLPEVVITLGRIPLVSYGTPGTEEIYKPLEPLIKDHDAFILQNHGALTIADSLERAYFRMETLEHFAHIAFIAKMIGNIHTLEVGEIGELLRQREKAGLSTAFKASECSPTRTGACSILESGGRTVEPAGTDPLPSAPFDLQKLIREVTASVIQSLTDGK